MGISCGTKCAKYTLIVFNLIFFFAGLAALGIGIWILVDKSTFVTLTARVPDDNVDLSKYRASDSVMHQAAYLLIAGGGVAFIMAFLGCCGAIKEWRPLLILYSIFLLIVLGLEIAAGIYAGVFRSTATDFIKQTMELTLQKQYEADGLRANGINVDIVPGKNMWTYAWDQMMIQLGCCGLTNGRDFEGAMSLAAYRPTVPGAPLACCRFRNQVTLLLEAENCAISRLPTTSLSATNYNDGCLPKLNDWIDLNLRILIGVGIGIGLIQIIGIVLACCLCWNLAEHTTVA